MQRWLDTVLPLPGRADARPVGPEPAAGDAPGSRRITSRDRTGARSPGHPVGGGRRIRPTRGRADQTSDGVNSVITAPDLREGQVVITGETAAAAQGDVRNPFLPRAIRR